VDIKNTKNGARTRTIRSIQDQGPICRKTKASVLNRRNLDLSVRKVQRWKDRPVNFKSAGAFLQNSQSRAGFDRYSPGWLRSEPPDLNPMARIACMRRGHYSWAASGGARQRMTAGSPAQGSNRARALDSLCGLHGDEVRDTTGRPRAVWMAQERRRWLPSRRGGTERRSKLQWALQADTRHRNDKRHQGIPHLLVVLLVVFSTAERQRRRGLGAAAG
jgi:hypothetical protein